MQPEMQSISGEKQMPGNGRNTIDSKNAKDIQEAETKYFRKKSKSISIHAF